MEIRKEFEAEGWEVRYMRTKVKVYHPKHGEYHVCSKYYGGGGYEEELTNAFTYLKTKGLIDMEATYCEGCGVLCIADLCTDCLHKEESFPCNECDCEYGDGSCSDCIEIQRAEGRYEELWEDDDA